jgi:hypothetical protein
VGIVQQSVEDARLEFGQTVTWLKNAQTVDVGNRRLWAYGSPTRTEVEACPSSVIHSLSVQGERKWDNAQRQRSKRDGRPLGLKGTDDNSFRNARPTPLDPIS